MVLWLDLGLNLNLTCFVVRYRPDNHLFCHFKNDCLCFVNERIIFTQIVENGSFLLSMLVYLNFLSAGFWKILIFHPCTSHIVNFVIRRFIYYQRLSNFIHIFVMSYLLRNKARILSRLDFNPIIQLV